MILIVKSIPDLSRFALFFTAAALLPVLTGCGQPGPLYLPAKPPTPVKSETKTETPRTPAQATERLPAASSVPASK